jgi:predicted DNA binding CopG/RHH family protein
MSDKTMKIVNGEEIHEDKLTPEEVGRLVNRHLDELVELVWSNKEMVVGVDPMVCFLLGATVGARANQERRATPEELAQEATAWADGSNTLKGWEDAPEAVPRQAESTMISIRMPTKVLGALREFAQRQGIGYQVLMKKWIEDRIREEAKLYIEHQ